MQEERIHPPPPPDPAPERPRGIGAPQGRAASARSGAGFTAPAVLRSRMSCRLDAVAGLRPGGGTAVRPWARRWRPALRGEEGQVQLRRLLGVAAGTPGTGSRRGRCGDPDSGPRASIGAARAKTTAAHPGMAPPAREPSAISAGGPLDRLDQVPGALHGGRKSACMRMRAVAPGPVRLGHGVPEQLLHRGRIAQTIAVGEHRERKTRWRRAPRISAVSSVDPSLVTSNWYSRGKSRKVCRIFQRRSPTVRASL